MKAAAGVPPVNGVHKMGGVMKYQYGGTGEPPFDFYTAATQATQDQYAASGVPVNNGIPFQTPFLQSIRPNNQGQMNFNPNVQPYQGSQSGVPAATSGGGINWGSMGKGAYDAAATIAPYAANAINLRLIGKTPEVPVPTALVANTLTANPMKTNYNANPALNEVQSQYRQFTKGIDDNTANSNTSRANKLAGFSSVIDQKSKIYGEKENIETALINKDIMNRQSVSDRNLRNSQEVSNQNRVRLDEYRMNQAIRKDNIRTQLSTNAAANVETFTKQVQDKNSFNNDQSKILLNSLQYGDAAGLATMIGTQAMDDLISADPNNYYTIEERLTKAGQNAALEKFRSKYKAPK
jgi:hypothetical protein